MTKRLVCMFAAGGVLVFSATAAQAAKNGKQKDPDALFHKLDKDGNNQLSQSEFVGKKQGEKAEQAEKRFKAKDANGDGSLTLGEFKSKAKIKAKSVKKAKKQKKS